MTEENEVYFPLTGDEQHGFVCVRLFAESDAMKAEASVSGDMTSEADHRNTPTAGDPGEVLREARELAAVRGLDLRVKLDGVEWDPELGTLVL